MSMHATYSPEDNKLRLYSTARLDAETYAKIKAAGFKWAPKQDLFVAPAWMPGREDLLLDLCREIGDEDYSPEERSADRAERFEGYRDKRADEAGISADAFDDGPSAFGNQSRARAERQAARHDRKRTYAVSQWSKAEYWQTRTEAAIGHALYRSSAPVRRSRILRLEADQRKHEKNREEYATRFAAWSKVATLDGADFRQTSPDGFLETKAADGRKSLYSLLTDPRDPITPAEAAALWLENASDPNDEDGRPARWSRHYELRLGYEKAMLAQEGGSAAEAEMEPGGFIGRTQIHAVNRSPATGRVVSVKVMAEHPWEKNADGTPLICLRSRNVERLGENAYRAPTDAEREAFKASTAKRKADAKASTPKAPPLVNPTDEDAERLQALWNDEALAVYSDYCKRHGYGRPDDFVPTPVRRMTQAEYSARSKGYGNCETVDVCENGLRPKRWDGNRSAQNPPVACNVRKTFSGSNWGFTGKACAVIVLTDKPQKPLPLDWSAIAESVETLVAAQ